MKRDMELCRKILLEIEEFPTNEKIDNLEIDGYSDEQVSYHCKLLQEAELISDYKVDRFIDGTSIFRVGSLTWKGHDFLDKIREDTVWDKTKATIKAKGLPMILDVIKEVASAVIASMTTAAISGMI